MARRPGFFQRTLKALGKIAEAAVKPIERVFQGEPRPSRRPETEFHRRRRLQQQQQRQRQRQPQPQPQPRPRAQRPPRRPYDPFRAAWNRHLGSKDWRYQDQRDFMRDIFYTYDISGDRQTEMWRDYVKWMVKPGQKFRRNDPRGPFWRKYGITPSSWDWHAWREAMGYPHGNRR